MADPFATADDVAARWRPLSDSEKLIAGTLCGDSSTLIRQRFPGIDAQVTAGSLDAGILIIVVAGMVKRAMVAPADGITQQSESVGPFARSQSYANPLGNVFLTQADITLILGYIPAGGSHGFSNDTTRVENCGPAYVYGFWT